MTEWQLWQLVDSAFPSGGFTHSFGLEAAWQSGEVANEEALTQFLRDSLWQAGYGALPLASAAFRDPRRLGELDALCDAFLTNAVANRASRVQGRAFLSACARVWPCETLASLEREVRSACGHHAPVAGATLAAVGASLTSVHRLLLFMTARGVLTAAVRLGLIGPYRAQRLQHACTAVLDEVLAACGGLDERSLAQTAPILDLVQATHDRLYSRLFQS